MSQALRGTAVVPTHTRLRGVRRKGVRPRWLSFLFSLVGHVPFSFLCNSFGAHHYFLGQAWSEGKGVLATGPYCADSGEEPDRTNSRHDLRSLHRSTE